jgi:hypothetical protein
VLLKGGEKSVRDTATVLKHLGHDEGDLAAENGSYDAAEVSGRQEGAARFLLVVATGS